MTVMFDVAAQIADCVCEALRDEWAATPEFEVVDANTQADLNSLLGFDINDLVSTVCFPLDAAPVSVSGLNPDLAPNCYTWDGNTPGSVIRPQTGCQLFTVATPVGETVNIQVSNGGVPYVFPPGPLVSGGPEAVSAWQGDQRARIRILSGPSQNIVGNVGVVQQGDSDTVNYEVCFDTRTIIPAQPGWVGDCCVWPGGQVAFDACCDTKDVGGGPSQVWVVASDGYPTLIFPTPDTEDNLYGGCSGTGGRHSLAMRFEIGAIRCVCPAVCDCDQKESDADKVFRDLQAMLTGLECCFNAAEPGSVCGDRDWRLLDFSMIGPEGGCAGSRINIVVHVPAPCCTTG